ncbi:3'-5' RNA helicase ythdc2 [Rhizophlyctis rosea]|nr:3'-5' RNA helicase ythdc2 [Rhizophlyctis rosea]
MKGGAATIAEATKVLSTQQGLRKGIWSVSTTHKDRFNRAFREGKTILIIFSVPEQYRFQGYAKMTSPVGSATDDEWTKRIGGGKTAFTVQWLKSTNVTYGQTIMIRDEYNKHSSINRSPDGRELHPKAGTQLCKVIDTQEAKLEKRLREGMEGAVHPPRRSVMGGDDQYYECGEGIDSVVPECRNGWKSASPSSSPFVEEHLNDQYTHAENTTVPPQPQYHINETLRAKGLLRIKVRTVSTLVPDNFNEFFQQFKDDKISIECTRADIAATRWDAAAIFPYKFGQEIRESWGSDAEAIEVESETYKCAIRRFYHRYASHEIVNKIVQVASGKYKVKFAGIEYECQSSWAKVDPKMPSTTYPPGHIDIPIADLAPKLPTHIQPTDDDTQRPHLARWKGSFRTSLPWEAILADYNELMRNPAKWPAWVAVKKQIGADPNWDISHAAGLIVEEPPYW